MNSLTVNAPIGGTGYGITSYNIIKEISQLGVDITLFPIGSNFQLNDSSEEKYIRSLIDKKRLFKYDNPSLKIWHQNDLASRYGKGDYYVFTFFEVDTLPENEIHHLNYPDGIFVASKWAKQVLENNGVKTPVYVAPLGVDRNIFRPIEKISFMNSTYRFFHVGKYEIRKSHDFMLRAFDLAFNEEDDVEFWMLPFSPIMPKGHQQQLVDMVNEHRLRKKIRLQTPLPTQHDVAKFINVCDCGVFVSRAEGWNNSLPDAMSMNKPVIATNYSAHTEYCNEKNSYLVNIKEIEPAFDGLWFNGEGNWAKLGSDELEQTVEYMKYVYNNNIRENPFGVETAKSLTWKNTASIINDTLEMRNSYADSQ